jgi:hypothetical protein
MCEEVTYYPRKIFSDPLFCKLPYIVGSREDKSLLENLLKDEYPILFEGVHCCFYLDHPSLAHRIKILRMHNIEHVYYKNLAKVESNVFKKYFFQKEAKRLKEFDSHLAKADAIAAISPDDYKLLNLRFDDVFYLPVFHGNKEVVIGKGDGKYSLYHGNLSVGENNEAALYLVNQVFAGLKSHLIIAGSGASKQLKEAVGKHPNIIIRENITTKEINELISNAKINLLPTFQNTGMKLKLINVLFQGNAVIVNNKMVKNTGLEDLCYLADNADAMKQAILYFMDNEPEEGWVQQRENVLNKTFNNHNNALILMDKIQQLTKKQQLAH